MHILLADDSRAISVPLIAHLEQAGHRVTYVRDGRAAVDTYQTARPDLVLMDVVMPELDGIEATRQIKALDSSRWVPIIMLTGLCAPEEVVAGLDAGADEYLTKPLNLSILDARLRALQRTAEIQDSLYAILDNAFDAIISIDELGLIRSFNRAAEKIFGYSAAQTLGQNVNMLMPEPYAHAHDGYLARYRHERIPHVIGSGRKVRGRRSSGETFPMHLAVMEIVRPNGNLYIATINDISAEEQARERIEFLALHDPLTGLPNRANFTEALEAVLRDIASQQHAVLFIDLDGFKLLNDQFGHETGDQALKTVATRLRHNLAANDFAARLGGDEFVAVARNVGDAGTALMVAQRLVAAIAEPMTLLGQPCQLGASIGVAMIPTHGQTVNSLLHAADEAMYAAKRGGKNRAALADTP